MLFKFSILLAFTAIVASVAASPTSGSDYEMDLAKRQCSGGCPPPQVCFVDDAGNVGCKDPVLKRQGCAGGCPVPLQCMGDENGNPICVDPPSKRQDSCSVRGLCPCGDVCKPPLAGACGDAACAA